MNLKDFFQNDLTLMITFTLSMVFLLRGLFHVIFKKGVITLGILKPIWLTKAQSVLLGFFYLILFGISLSIFISRYLEINNIV